MFISYARKNERQAQALVRAIEAEGHEVWWDALIQGGEGFAERIAAALERASVVIVLWSEAAIASNWVRDEAQIGADRGRLVPVSLDGSLPPLGFRQFQTIAFDGGRTEAIRRIVDAMAAFAGAPQATRPAAGAARVPGRRAVILGGAALVAAGGAGAAWRLGYFGTAAARSIAVLPFDNIGGDPAKAYFADGVAAEIRAQLARDPQLMVAANTSSDAAGKGHADARAIAAKLNVAYLLGGNVRRAGDRVRVTAELVAGETGFTTWSDTFDRPAADVFAVQDEIAGAVVAAMNARLFGRGGAASTKVGGTGNLAAYDAYLRGRSLYEQAAGEATDRAALQAFDQAISADPNYASAYAARSRTLTVIANQYAQGAARRDSYDQAIVAARKAVDLAPASAPAQSALGFALFYGHIDQRAAEAPFQLSAKLGSGDADVLGRYALFLTRTGRFAPARAALARARALDPLNARIAWMRAELEVDARRFADAIPLAVAALGLNPTMSAAHATIGAARLLMSDLAGAEAAYRQEPSSLFGTAGLAIVLKRLRRDGEAEAQLAALEHAHGDNGLYQQAQVHAQWGDAAAALVALNKARDTGDAGLTHLRTDPLLDPIRREGEFVTLQRTLGLA